MVLTMSESSLKASMSLLFSSSLRGLMASIQRLEIPSISLINVTNLLLSLPRIFEFRIIELERSHPICRNSRSHRVRIWMNSFSNSIKLISDTKSTRIKAKYDIDPLILGMSTLFRPRFVSRFKLIWSSWYSRDVTILLLEVMDMGGTRSASKTILKSTYKGETR